MLEKLVGWPFPYLTTKTASSGILEVTTLGPYMDNFCNCKNPL
jgi:hypothetical protein